MSFGRASEGHRLSFLDGVRAFFSRCVFRSICVNKFNTSKEKSAYIQQGGLFEEIKYASECSHTVFDFRPSKELFNAV